MPEPVVPPREFTAQQKHRAIIRELGQRENLYPRLIASGKLAASAAERQLEVLRAIARDYEERHRMLFGEDPL